MSAQLISVLGLCSCALAVLVSYFWRKNSYNMKLPPGPAGQLLLGNLLQIPAVEPWKQFREWSKKYGESCFVFFWSTSRKHWYGVITNEGGVVLVRLPIQPTIVLCTVQAVFDLLDKRSNIYSDRPRSVMDQLYGDLSDPSLDIIYLLEIFSSILQILMVIHPWDDALRCSLEKPPKNDSSIFPQRHDGKLRGVAPARSPSVLTTNARQPWWHEY